MPSPSYFRRQLSLWALAITLAVLIGGAVVGYFNAQRLLANERLVGHSDDAIVDLTRLLSAVRDAERSQRGYLLTDGRSHLGRYRDAKERLQRETARLTREVSKNPDQQARLTTLRYDITLKVAQLDRMILLQNEGDEAGALAIVRSGTGKRLMDEITARVDAMRSAEYSLLARRAANSRLSSLVTVIAMVAPALIGAILIGLMFYFGNRRIVELNEADRQKDEFLALLAHELRGPLAPLSNGLELIKHSRGAEDLRQRACSLMERQLEQLIRLVNDLLDASRIARGKIELQRTATDLGALIREVAEVERPQAEGAGLRLEASLPAEPLFVDGDPVRLTQVFRNLLQNARKYTEPGGRIEVSLAPERGQAAVRVRDTGLGIPPAKLEAIFEMFAQMEAGLPRSQGGLGIGLALARQLLALHGGSVQAFSEGPGRGSEFVVRLPLAAHPRERGPRIPREEVPAPSRRIVIADDNTDTAASLAALLQLAGHETYTAHDGMEALRTAERLHPDVVLLDIQMPLLDGYEVCRRIRQRPWGKSVTLIAVTGLGQPQDRLRSREAGFDEHLTKPPDYGEITRLLMSPRLGRAGTAAASAHDASAAEA
ncbi:MAG TPA: CHASE3 domain-containing protein [Steroidobacteraceae bacterium]|nr:CHASE3 domain-containing protein [Steroidobacteraceae bacterium]